MIYLILGFVMLLGFILLFSIPIIDDRYSGNGSKTLLALGLGLAMLIGGLIGLLYNMNSYEHAIKKACYDEATFKKGDVAFIKTVDTPFRVVRVDCVDAYNSTRRYELITPEGSFILTGEEGLEKK